MLQWLELIPEQRQPQVAFGALCSSQQEALSIHVSLFHLESYLNLHSTQVREALRALGFIGLGLETLFARHQPEIFPARWLSDFAVVLFWRLRSLDLIPMPPDLVVIQRPHRVSSRVGRTLLVRRHDPIEYFDPKSFVDDSN